MVTGKRLILALVVVVIVALIFLVLVNIYISSRYKSTAGTLTSQTSGEVTRTFTAEELKQFNGTDPNLPIYLALEGLVYDVTTGKEFYVPGGPYHSLAGKDSSVPLSLVGGDIIKKKYPVVGKLEK